jgi:hypothetical protein
VPQRHLDDGGELLVLLVLEADIAGVDAVFVERLRAASVFGEQLVADVVKVAHQRRRDAPFEKPLLDARHGSRRLIAVDGDAHEFRAGRRQCRHLPRRRLDVGRVGIGHRLHDDRRPAAYRDAANLHRDSFVPLYVRTHSVFHAIPNQTDIAGRVRTKVISFDPDLPGPVNQQQTYCNQRHGGGKGGRQRIAQYQVSCSNAEQRREKSKS